ncbi:cystathionine gamma-lyase-like [Catharus ustulatus]|uniref:cystathionine gamma-lyase-like n=1 Tax=Catharus ustulatus TaxID=91951 RepID=UPI00140DF1B3|nr:cystathionine gamma-lyase-like [Catharus ustulatus]
MDQHSCSGFLPPFPHFATQAIHYAQEPEQWNSRAVVPPITLSTSFKQEDPEVEQPYVYTRYGNPSRHILEEVVGTLDGAGGQRHLMDCLAYSSGVGAILNICHLLKSGDKIVCTQDVYAGTREILNEMEKKYNLQVKYVDCTKPKCLEAAITPETKLVWLESPSNPTMKVLDIRACAEAVHGIRKDLLVAVDNSFMSPYFQRPLSLGADISMSSGTKYINGHSDVLMGLVSVNSKELYEKLKFLQKYLGAVPSPFDCYMCNRGLKTLHIRMKLHFQNGLAVAKFLKGHPRVQQVLYPGLPSHPQYEVTRKQCTGVSGMLSFYIKGNEQTVFAFLKNLKVFTVGFSLGGFESLASHPATMSHASLSAEDKERLGISDTLIRLSVGLEDEQDLLQDLDQALKAAVSGEFPSKNNPHPAFPSG